MQGTIAITDEGWYRFLPTRREIDEVNFWTPSARRRFNAVPFSPFLFKLRAPHRAVCGFANFEHYSTLPDWLAWDTYGFGNGCESFDAMRRRIREIRTRIRYDEGTGSDEIGCILLRQPVFFPPDAWVPQPEDWSDRTQGHVKYDLSSGVGLRVWTACLESAKAVGAELLEEPVGGEGGPRYGTPRLVAPRLGQRTFQVAVLDAYSRACCVTGEHSLPALEAAHIRPYASSGPHEVPNGLLLRADLHRLFDKGYVTVTPEFRLEVGVRLRKDFRNGRSYYPLQDVPVRVPKDSSLIPSAEYLTWHREHRFLG